MKKIIAFIFVLSMSLLVSCAGKLAPYRFEATNSLAKVTYILSSNASFLDSSLELAFRLHGSILSNSDVTDISLRYCVPGKNDNGQAIYASVAEEITIQNKTSSNLISRLRKIPDVSALRSLPELGELILVLNRPWLFPKTGETASKMTAPALEFTDEQKAILDTHRKWVSYESKDEYGRIHWVLKDYGHPQKVITQALDQYNKFDAGFKVTYHNVYYRRMRNKYYRGNEISAMLAKMARLPKSAKEGR